MKVWIAVHISELALEAYFPRNLPDPKCVVLDQQRVVALSTAARDDGLRLGMGRSAVLTYSSSTVIVERDPLRERNCLDAIAMALLQYTPEVACAEESVLLMDVGASLVLFGGVRALCRRIQTDMRALGFTARLGCAPTSRGAWLLAKTARRSRTLKMSTLSARFERVPALTFPAARRFSAWLEGIGCNTVAELRRLPRPGLQRRCGRELLDMLDAAYGLLPEMHHWVETPEVFRGHLEIYDRVEKADELLVGAHRLVLQMLGWLAVRQLAVQRVVLEMAHERGRVARPPSKLEISLADPAWRIEHLLRLLKERLAKHVLEAPVIGLVLEAVDLVPMEPLSESLFPDPREREVDQQRLVELLVARLGAENVLCPAIRADYRPEVVNTWTSTASPVRFAELQAALPPPDLQFLRPTWILAKPIQLLMRNNRPFYCSPLRIVSGLERIEAGWWDATQSRDYFIAEGADYALYWVYRERVSADDGAQDPRWFLHGLFG